MHTVNLKNKTTCVSLQCVDHCESKVDARMYALVGKIDCVKSVLNQTWCIDRCQDYGGWRCEIS